MRSRSISWGAPVVALSLLAAACGDDSGDSGDAAEPAAETTSAEPAAGGTAGEDTGAGTDTTAATDATDATTETTGSDGSADECTEERQGGSVTIALFTEPASLDPAAVAGSAATGTEVLAQIYDTLVGYDPAAGEYYPRVAESLEPDDTFTEWTLSLRDGIVFGNGDPLTADAVKASIERFGELATGPYANLVGKITEMEVVDDQTLVFRLDEEWPGFPYTLAVQPGMIVNTSVAEEAGDAFAADPAGAGVGAFEATRYVSGEEVVLEAKDDYWGGVVCLEQLRFVPQPADATRLEAFQAGDVDVAWLRDPNVIQQASGVPGFDYTVNAASVILFNAGVGAPSPANDVRVRQGLQYAIDLETVHERATQGAGSTVSAVIGEDSRYYSGIEGPQYDLERATELIDQAKADGWDGSIRLLCDGSRQDLALAVAGHWEAAGVTVETEFTSNANELIDAVIINQDFDATCWGLNVTDESLWAGFSNNMVSGSPSNYGGLQDQEMDEAIDALRVAVTDDEIQSALQSIQERWTETAPSLIMDSTVYRTIHTEELAGLQPTSNSLLFYADAYLTS